MSDKANTELESTEWCGARHPDDSSVECWLPADHAGDHEGQSLRTGQTLTWAAPPSDELYRAIVVQLGELETIGVRPTTDAADVARKQARIDRLRAWAATLPGDLQRGYSAVLDTAEASIRDWHETRAFQDRVSKIKLPPLPPD